MHEMIERYIHDVTRRLPEKEREDIRRELESNITDMLPEAPGESDIHNCLTALGSPCSLAEQYRAKPRYLISPAMFESYISVLRLVVSIVAAVCFCVGLVISITSGSVAGIIGSAFSMAFEGALQAALWITVGFAIADRSGVKPDAWTPADLPPLPNLKAVRIQRSSSLAGMIVSVFFTVLFIMMILRDEWFFVIAHDAVIINPFTQAALTRFIPYLIVMGCLGLVASGFKLLWARWTLPLCIINAIYNAAWLSIMLYVLHWPDVWSGEFIDFAATLFNQAALPMPMVSTLTAFFTAVFIFSAVLDTASGVWNTWKGSQRRRI